MKINSAEIGRRTLKSPTFKSIRTDKATVQQLSKGENPILENNKENIYAALNRLSLNPNKNSIEFLLDVAANLAYGQGNNNSDFKKSLDKDGITPQERENTKWSEILDDTIMRAFKSTSDDTGDLAAEYYEICENNKKISPEQQKLLDLRKEFTDVIVNESVLDDEQTLITTARIRKNLDYFTASSEIPIKQKQKCLELFLYFMSDEYKIIPQLKDKKLQVIDEMLNDMLIKTPEDEVLTTKTIDQRSSGICAAISICRKMLAYEDKPRFVEIITDELQDSPEMTVYDITELGSGKKVKIPKTNIDYNSALEKGYRIIDASAHNWMHNAHASGDGTIQTEHYIPFDKENYGIYNDSSWYLGLDNSKADAKKLLQALIKEKEFLKSFTDTKKEIKNTNQNVHKIKKDVYESKKLSRKGLNTVFSDIFPEKTDSEISGIINSLISFYNGKSDENEVNVAPQLPKEIKQNIIEKFITDTVPDVTKAQKDQIKKELPKIYSLTDEYTLADHNLKKLQNLNSPSAKYRYNKKLFNLAAAHRIAIEADVNMPDGEVRYERVAGLPPRDIQIADYMKLLKNSFVSPAVRKIYSGKDRNVASQEELEKQLNSDLLKIETIIPFELNSVIEKTTGESSQYFAYVSLKVIAEKIKKNEDPEIFETMKLRMGIDGDKNKVIEEINKIADKISVNPSQEDFLETIRLLGYKNNIDFTESIVNYYISFVSEEIDEETYKSLLSRFGDKDKIVTSLKLQQDKLNKLQEEYNQIINKWKIPSARTNILNKLETNNCVLSRKNLDTLQDKFNSITAETVKNEKITNTKERKKANNKLYKFTNEEKEIFDSIEKSLPYMKKFNKIAYQEINDILREDLDKQYSHIGMLNGQFWVREEGSSGLSSNEQIRIIEQMTGKPYHMEDDILKAAKEIKEGNGSGIVSLSVDDKDYAFHAQYAPFVSTEIFKNPVTDEKTKQDVVWLDNSWGKAEKEHFWNGHNGFLYTDYNQGYGWKDGFILSDNYLIGLRAKDISGASGISKEDNEKFGLFSNMILPGMPNNSYAKIYKMFDKIFTLDDYKVMLSQLESYITGGYKFNLNEIEKIDDVAEIKQQNIEKRIEKEINSKEDFDKLPQDDELKFIFKKIAFYLSCNNPQYTEDILKTNNNKDMENLLSKIRETQLNQMKAIAGKSNIVYDCLYTLSFLDFQNLFEEIKDKYNISFSDEEINEIISEILYTNIEPNEKYRKTLDELEKQLKNQIIKVSKKNIKSNKGLLGRFSNKSDYEAQCFFIDKAAEIINKNLRIKDLDSPVLSLPMGRNLILAVDKYLNPENDKELLTYIQKLQEDYKYSDEFFNRLQDEDININIEEPYTYVQLYKADNSNIKRVLSEIIYSKEINSMMNVSEDDEENTPEELYRDLYIKLTDMDVQKYIKAFKAEAFQKYQVRQAFPQPVVIPDDLIENQVDMLFSTIESISEEIDNNNMSIDCLSKYDSIKNKFGNKTFYQNLINNSDVEVTIDNRKDLSEFKSLISELYELSANNELFAELATPLENLITSLQPVKNIINGESAGYYLNEIENIFNTYAGIEIKKSNFVQLKQDNVKKLKENIKVLVNTNVEPIYRDEATKNIYKYIRLYKNHANEEEIETVKDKIYDLFINKHIIKNPTILLRECVKMLFNGEQSSNEYSILHSYLEYSLNTAQQTQVQYKLVQNQHEGISSKTKQLLDMFKINVPNGKNEGLNSENGMLYLVSQLENNSDNYTILNLFLEQSGLSKQTLDALIKNFNEKDYIQKIDEKSEKIKENITSLDKLADTIYKYNQQDKAKFFTIKSSVKAMIKFLKNELGNYKDNEIYNQYISYLENLKFNEKFNQYQPDIIELFTQESSNNAFYYVNDVLNSQLDDLISMSESIGSSIILINSINVPPESNEFKMQADFTKKLEDIQKYIYDKNKEFIEIINASKYLNT